MSSSGESSRGGRGGRGGSRGGRGDSSGGRGGRGDSSSGRGGRGDSSGGRGGRGGRGDFGGGRGGRGDFGGRGGGRGGRGGRGGFNAGPAPVQGPAAKFVAALDVSGNQLQTITALKADGFVEKTIFQPRPDFGKNGENCKVGTNNVVYDVKGLKVYKYVVSFPKELEAKKSLRIDLMNNLLSQLIAENKALAKQIGHDHNDNILSFAPIPVKDRNFEAFEAITGEGKPTPVTISESTAVDMEQLMQYCNLASTAAVSSDMTVHVNALDVLLTSRIGSDSKPGVYPGAFKLSANKIMVVDKFRGDDAIDKGLYLCSGFLASVRPTFGRVLINVKRTAAAFYKAHNPDGSNMNFLEYCADYFGTTDTRKMADLMAKNRNFFTGIKITRPHLKHSRPKAIFSIGVKSANDLKFKNQDGKMLTVAQYFKEQYNTVLKAPDFPLIHLGGTTYLPAECAYIMPAQPYRGKIVDTTTMLNFTKRPALDTAKILANDILPQVRGQDERIGKDMMLVPARILPAPVVQYKNKNITSSPADPTKKGAWNLQGCKFMTSGRAKPVCAFIVITDRFCKMDGLMKDAIAAFFKELQNCGLDFKSFTTKEVPLKGMNGQALGDLENDVFSACRSLKDSNYALVVLPQKNAPIYEAVKRATDLRAGINSNCAVANKMTKKRGPSFDLGYFANIAMKVNLKLGGSNHVLGGNAALPAGTMLMGADVTHSTNVQPGKVEGLSIASVVGSYDKWHSNFPGSLRAQKSNQEAIAELQAMTTERLDYYFSRNNALPKHIVFYRDGVSESQFKMVIEHELAQIKRAIDDAVKKNGKGKEVPKLTLLSTVKRTNMRFFPVDEKTDKGNPCVAMDNVLAGATIDRGVTSPYLFDFFIQSQQLPQKGTTATPTHYYVLYDSAGYKSDDIQKITYDLCHIFSRATRSVRVCPPAYYADLLCTRGRCYIKPNQPMPNVSQGVNNTMYYI